MYSNETVEILCDFIKRHDGINDKAKLGKLVQDKFSLIQDRKVFYCKDFAIRFSKSENKRMSNTVLSLSALQKYDDRPFIVCIVSSSKNYMELANSTFLKKISHSSQELRVDNIKGSFNGGDIMDPVNGLENCPDNFKELFLFHSSFTFDENLERLVESTNGIVGRVQKFTPSPSQQMILDESIKRAKDFISSDYYKDLINDLDTRTSSVQNEIAIAAFIDNVNIRGRIIEYLITDNGSDLKNRLIDSLRNNKAIESFKTEDKLGDYNKDYDLYSTSTDIKTKVLFLDGNPKAYNIDKLLEFLASDKSVYMIYLIGINEDKSIITRLCSVFDKRLIEATNIIHHWAGRNSRGVAQFIGKALSDILYDKPRFEFDESTANAFLKDMISK